MGQICSDPIVGGHRRSWVTTILSALECYNVPWCMHAHTHCNDWREQRTIRSSIFWELGVKKRCFKQSERGEDCLDAYVWYENATQRNLMEKKELSCMKLRAVYWVCVRGWRPLAASNYESFPRHAPLASPLDGIKRPQGPSLGRDKGDVIYQDLCKADRSAN